MFVGIETDRGPWVTALRAAGYQVFAINPLSSARYRERYSTSGAKSDAGKGFMIAHLKGIRDYYRAVIAGKADRAPICAIIHKHDNNIPDTCAGVTLSGADPNGALNVEALERYQDEWLKWGVMSDPADIRAHVNTSFVDAALAKLGRYEQ